MVWRGRLTQRFWGCNGCWGCRFTQRLLYPLKEPRKRKRHININFLLWLPSGWPPDNRPVNRTKKFMCSPLNPVDISVFFWLTGSSPIQKVYVSNVYVPFLAWEPTNLSKTWVIYLRHLSNLKSLQRLQPLYTLSIFCGHWNKNMRPKNRVFLNLWFGKPMVCLWVAFHENDWNHENDENDEDNSDSYKQGVQCWNLRKSRKWRKPRESGVQTTGSPNNGFRNTRKNKTKLNCKKPLTHVSKRVPGVHGKRGLERGWQKRLAKGWRKLGEGSANGWRISLHPPISEFPRRPFRDMGLWLWVHGDCLFSLLNVVFLVEPFPY